MRKKRTAYLLLLPLAGVTALVLAACAGVLAQSLGYVPAFGLEELTLDYYRAALARPEFRSALLASLRVALLSALAAAALGTALCAALVRLCRAHGPMVYLIRLPILVPHTVTALFTILLLSQTGLLSRIAWALGVISDPGQFPQFLFTPGYGGAILAYLWKEIPFVAYFTLALMAGVSDTLGEAADHYESNTPKGEYVLVVAAENLGASPLRSFLAVTLPLSLPAVSRAFLIIFLFAFGGYELPMLLGATMPKALPVYAHLTYMSPDLRQRPAAMALYGVILLLSAAMALLYHLLTRRLLRKMGGGR